MPFSAGGSADRVARNLAPFLEKELGTSIVVENKPGASGQVGTMMTLAKPADGNTILLHAQPYFTAAEALQGAPFARADIEPLNVQNVGNISITVKSDAAWGDFAALDAAIRATPGKIAIGTVRGGAAHLLALLLEDKLGWDVKIVTCDSGAPVRTALLGGQIDVSMNGAVSDAAMKPEVRPLGLSTSQKISAFPDAPYLNDVLKAQEVTLPETGDIRFLAVKAGTAAAYPERFGTGEPDGGIAAEAANNASEGGAMATMLAPGIPGGAATAILIGALTIQGIVPVVVIMSYIGAYSVRNAGFDAMLLVGCGIVGWLMKREGYPVVAVVIGIMLGSTADAELIRMHQLYGDDWSQLWTSPICVVLFFATLASLAVPLSQALKKRCKARALQGT